MLGVLYIIYKLTRNIFSFSVQSESVLEAMGCCQSRPKTQKELRRERLKQAREAKAAENGNKPRTEQDKEKDKEQMKRVGAEVAGAVMYGKPV